MLLLLSFLPVCLSTFHYVKDEPRWPEQGCIKGKIFTEKATNRSLQIYKGIPYAEPPIGNLRFKKPVKKGTWTRVNSSEGCLTGFVYAPPCLQFMEFHRHDKYAGKNMERESEDCLYLNIFSPYDEEDQTGRHPVLVWIHGGSFLAGSADTGIDDSTVAHNIVFKGVTLVTLNYRLGPLGFMNYNVDGRVEGNFGIYDMVQALEWIKSNIWLFNGDASRVTVMGESAGAAAASLLALSPLTQGVVHQAIIMSGSSAAGWAVHNHGTPQWNIDNIVAYLRCERVISEEDVNEIVGGEFTTEEIEKKYCNYQDKKISCLTHDMTQVETLACLQTQLNFSSSLFRRALATELGVSKIVVDGVLLSSSGIDFIRENARVPVMIGVAKAEWSHKKAQFYNLPRLSNLSKSEVEQAVFKIIDTSFHQSVKEKLSNSTLLLLSNASFYRYVDDSKGEFNTSDVVKALQKMEADIEFVSPAHREISAYQTRAVPVYAYSFDYMPNSSIVEDEKKVVKMLAGATPLEVKRVDATFDGHNLDAFHGLDHAFIFTQGYTSNFNIANFSARDRRLSDRLTDMWTNFIKSGNPSTPNIQWRTNTPSRTNYLSIGKTMRMVRGALHSPAPQFWNVEADLIANFVAKDSTEKERLDPTAALTNEERLQLGAYRRAWWALWVLVACLAVLLWGTVIYLAIRKSRSPRSKPYDNIVVAAR